MAIKINQNCTVYKDEKRAVKLADWRDYPIYDGQFIQRSDDFSLQDYNYDAMCENARLKHAKMMASIAPTPNVYAELPPAPEPTGFNIDQFLIPAALLGIGAIIAAIYVVKK